MRKIKPTRFHAEKILDWCVYKYGRSSYPYPILEFKKPDYITGEYFFGQYDFDDGTMFVNSEMNTTIEELVNTVLHEYCHYRFHKKSLMEQSITLLEYNKNPYEIHANHFAKSNVKKCLFTLKKYFKQFNL